MSNKMIGRVMVGIVLFIAIVTVDRCVDRSEDRWEARVEQALAQSALRQERIEELEAEADSLARVAEESAERATESAAVTDTLIVHLPPAETPGEAARDTVIARLVIERDDFKHAYHDQLAATGRLKAALAEVTEDRDSLKAVLEDRPGGRPWYLPRLGIGVSTGLDTQMRPNTVAGGTLMWEIDFGGGS